MLGKLRGRLSRIFGKVHGPALIHEAHGLFDGIIAKLEAGVHHSRRQIEANAATISAKVEENATLTKAVERAQNTAQNIRALVNVAANG